MDEFDYVVGHDESGNEIMASEYFGDPTTFSKMSERRQHQLEAWGRGGRGNHYTKRKRIAQGLSRGGRRPAPRPPGWTGGTGIK